MVLTAERNWKSALRLLRRHGLGAVLSVLESQLMPSQVVLHLVGLALRDLEGKGESLRSMAPCHRATRAEVEDLVAQAYEEPEAMSCFELGDPCLVQTVDGRFAGLVWLSTRPVVELLPGVRLRVPEDAVYSYKTWTHPDFRGHSLQSLRHRAILDFVREQGRNRLFAFVKSTNFASLKGVRKSGCRPIGRVRVTTRPDGVSFTVSITDPAWSGVGPAARS
jgi:GNAT superfamily N-acetyltransferase